MRQRIPFLVRAGALLCILLAGAVWLAGCCGANLRFRKCPAKIELHLTADAQLNSCTGQGAYEVVVRVYALAESAAFIGAEFEKLWDEPDGLGGAVLDVWQLTIEPGQVETFVWRRPAGARAIGVVANFCRHDAACWKRIVELPAGSQRMTLGLAGTCVTTFALRP